MLQAAEFLHRALVPFLLVAGSLVAALLGVLLIQRATRDLVGRRRQRLIARYRPLLDAAMQCGPTAEIVAQLRRIPPVHLPIVGSLLLAPLRTTRGELVTHVRGTAAALGLVDRWLTELPDRRWWRRADAVRALGFVEETSASAAIMLALTDDHEEVRAAAVEALGRLGDPKAIPALLDHLLDVSRYQNARIVDALWSLGPPVTPALVEFAAARPAHTRVIAEILGLIGTPTAIDPLLKWCEDPRADVRAAALGALGSIGLNDRSYYFTLRALGDPDPQTRAMAARALGRGRRVDAVGYLAERLDDEWLPASQAAWALAALGERGLATLRTRADDGGQAGDLARQMLWSERKAVPA